jgi:Ca2+-binding RTX toxin-like protein
MFRIRRIRGAYRRAGLTVALALAALAAVPAIASAAAVSTSGTVITFTAAGGETNALTVTQPGTNSYKFDEASISITESSANCTATSGDVTCSGVSWTSVVVNLGDSNGDVFTAAGVNDDPFTINGEGQTDTITGSSANDIIDGGGQADTINGGPGNDTLNGGAQDDNVNGDADNDRLTGGANADTLNGGTGIDRALYTTSTAGITVDMDNVADDADGLSGTDNVQDSVESITGSSFNDTITGSCFANTIAGDPGSTSGSAGGNDILSGDPTGGCTAASGSSDFFGGGEGNDSFNGDGTIDGTHFKGFDTVTYGFPFTGGGGISVDLDDVADDNDGFGNAGDNVNGDIERVIGNSSGDAINATAADQAVSLFGRDGADTLTDSPFGDFLNGEGGADTINCPNGGTDTYNVDPADTITGSCEIGT